MPLTAVETLRQDFDATFARPFGDAGADTDDLLAILVGQRRYALRVAELGGVAAGLRVTRVPAANPGLLGLVGLRGALFPVYDLARVLGEPPPVEPPRWLALSLGNERIALAFRELEGHLRLPRAALESAGRGHVAFVIREEAGLRSVVDVPGVVQALRGPGAPSGSGKGS
jgi:chemotaxis signal transduction protein